MSEPFLGEIRIFSYEFAPRGWASCNGQLLPINQNQALFSLLGTTYGGDGRVTFALPDLRGRVPIHFNAAHPLGERAGSESQTLSLNELPAHAHGIRATTSDATERTPTNNLPAFAEEDSYSAAGALTPLSASLASAGGNQPHGNMQPFLTINLCIALIGIYPSRN